MSLCARKVSSRVEVEVGPDRLGKDPQALFRVEARGAKGEGIFATTRVDNNAMHATLRKLGFERAGNAWPSGMSAVNLCLFATAAAK